VAEERMQAQPAHQEVMTFWKKTTAAIVLCLSTVAVTSCGPSTLPDSSAPTQKASAPATRQADWDGPGEPEVAPAVMSSKHSRADVMAAATAALNMTKRYGYSGRAADESHAAPILAFDALQFMTPACQKTWNIILTKWVNDDDKIRNKALNDVYSLLFDGYIDGHKTDDGRKVTLNGAGDGDASLTLWKVELLDDGRLLVDIESKGGLNLIVGGKKQTVSATRQQKFYMQKIDGRWLVDGWSGDFQSPGIK
jgi:hypothetical protein